MLRFAACPVLFALLILVAAPGWSGEILLVNGDRPAPGEENEDIKYLVTLGYEF